MQEFFVYLRLGIIHILDISAYDHMLFIAVLVIGFSLKNWKECTWLASAFTLGHSLTLALSIFELVAISPDLIETLIPVTIFLTAMLRLFQKSSSLKSIWRESILVMLFGLIHGLGFSNFLKVTLSQSQSVVLPLFSFNVGVELGQLAFLLIFLCIQTILINVLGRYVSLVFYKRFASVLVGLISLSLLF